jgi:hypothetical protein
MKEKGDGDGGDGARENRSHESYQARLGLPIGRAHSTHADRIPGFVNCVIPLVEKWAVRPSETHQRGGYGLWTIHPNEKELG